MKEGEFAKYKGKEFATSDNWGEITLFSKNLADIEKYGFEKCEPFDMYGFGRVVCEKDVPLSDVEEYYAIGLNAIYEGYKGGIGRPDKDNNVVIGFGCDDITPDEARRLGMQVDYGGYRKEVPMDELEIFEEREDWDIPKLVAMYKKAKEKNKEDD